MRKILSNFWETILAACVAASAQGLYAGAPALRHQGVLPAIEEIVSISFIYTIFLGAAVGMKRMEHLSIDFLLKRVSRVFRKSFAWCGGRDGPVPFLCGQEGIGFVRDSYTQTTTYLNLPMSYSYAAIPGSGLIMLYYLAKRTYATIRSEAHRPRPRAVTPDGSACPRPGCRLPGGHPIAFAIGLASLAFLLSGDIPLVLIVQRMYTGVDSSARGRAAFRLRGFLMETGGISRRIVDLALSIVGPVRGSLGMGAVASEMIFSGISGSSIADASAMGPFSSPPW